MRDQPRFQIEVRTYWEDTDASGIVYHGNYARYFERARSDWLRAQGIDQTQLATALGAIVVVRRMTFDLLRPARLDNLCWATVDVVQVKRASAVLRQELRLQHDDSVLVTADITVACLQADTLRPFAFPPPLQRLLEPLSTPEAAAA